MITTEDIGQEGSKKAGKLKGGGPHHHQGQGAIWGTAGSCQASGGIKAILGGTWVEVKEPGTHWAGNRQEGLG